MTGQHGARKLVAFGPVEMSVARCTVDVMGIEENKDTELPAPNAAAGQPDTFDDADVATLGAAIIAEHIHAFEVLAK